MGLSPGKQFEKDFFDSARKVMSVIRLKDPAASFGGENNLRFSPRNLCDAICYSYPNQFLFELKSHKTKSIPFNAIVSSMTDNRLDRMVEEDNHHKGIKSFVIFNWRDCDNRTIAVRAWNVFRFIIRADRKSIPYQWTIDNGIPIFHKLKKVHYSYNIGDFLSFT